MDDYEEYEFDLVNTENRSRVKCEVSDRMTVVARSLVNEIIGQFEEMIDKGEGSREFSLTLTRYWDN